jgi:hypothetical protein
MHISCDKVICMPHIQIRNVPPDLHRVLKARAALAGMSLSEYLLAEVRRSAAVPTTDELLARVRGLPKVGSGASSAEIIRDERARRDEA